MTAAINDSWTGWDSMMHHILLAYWPPGSLLHPLQMATPMSPSAVRSTSPGSQLNCPFSFRLKIIVDKNGEKIVSKAPLSPQKELLLVSS
jgi:hypothetical protein